MFAITEFADVNGARADYLKANTTFTLICLALAFGVSVLGISIGSLCLTDSEHNRREVRVTSALAVLPGIVTLAVLIGFANQSLIGATDRGLGAWVVGSGAAALLVGYLSVVIVIGAVAYLAYKAWRWVSRR